MTPSQEGFEKWVRRVDSLLKDTYSITVEDAGISTEDLRHHFHGEPNAGRFVRWFGQKYDLTENRAYE